MNNIKMSETCRFDLSVGLGSLRMFRDSNYFNHQWLFFLNRQFNKRSVLLLFHVASKPPLHSLVCDISDSAVMGFVIFRQCELREILDCNLTAFSSQRFCNVFKKNYATCANLTGLY